MVLSLSTLRTVLVRPRAVFEERAPRKTIGLAAGFVTVLAIAMTLAVVFLAELFAGTMEGTVTLDNPAHVPEQICEVHDNDSAFADGCDEPETIERDAGPLIREEVYGYLGYTIAGPFVLWAISGLVLFGAARVAGGAPSLTGSLAMAGWAALPELFRLGVGVLGIWIALRDVTIRDPERALEVVEPALAPIEPVLLLATILTALWQWYVITAGVSVDADLDSVAAAVAVAIPLWLFTLLTLV